MIWQNGWKREWRRSFPVTELFNAAGSICNRSSPTQASLQRHELSFIEEFKRTFLEKHTERTPNDEIFRERRIHNYNFTRAHNHKICSLDERKKNGWFKENVDWNGTLRADDSVWARRRINQALSAGDDKPKLRSLELLISSPEHIYRSIYFFCLFPQH